MKQNSIFRLKKKRKKEENKKKRGEKKIEKRSLIIICQTWFPFVQTNNNRMPDRTQYT